jgi:hypothetical protein
VIAINSQESGLILLGCGKSDNVYQRTYSNWTIYWSTAELIDYLVAIRVGLGPDHSAAVLIEHIEVIPGCYYNLGYGHVHPQTPTEQRLVVQASDSIKLIEFQP